MKKITLTEIIFSTTKEDTELISKIVKKAFELWPATITDSFSLNMDLTATHLNGNPLDLLRLLNADKFNFSHDIFGIMEHINRNTGKLDDCFIPRCSK